MSIGSWLPDLVLAVRLFGELSFISEAGVAGDGTLDRTAWRRFEGALDCCGAIYGEGFAERGFGIGGGGISSGAMSVNASGEIEPFSESVAPVDEVDARP